uniref:Small monomeric GTPase n=1 Tax=Panagrellus redivivus TaxID=6233 RepID=A0A7E4UPQ7_PANRE
MMSLQSRRSVRNNRLVRLPSNAEQTTSHLDGSSCPNSPAIKKVYRLVVVGTAQTGKTAIVNRFLDKEFEERYLPTIENFHRKLYKIRGEVYQLDILDRSGNDPFPAARKLSYISGDIFVVVSSVDQSQSVGQLADIRNQILECKVTRGFTGVIPIVFVLNKTDLPQYKWQVTVTEVEDLIKSATGESCCDSCFVTCSAANNENIDKVFGKVFVMGKLPKYMNPELHKMLRNELSADGALNGRKKAVLQKMRSKFSKDNEDEVLIDVNARRPSLRTDLLLNRAKTAGLKLNRTPSLTATSANAITYDGEPRGFGNGESAFNFSLKAKLKRQSTKTRRNPSNDGGNACPLDTSAPETANFVPRSSKRCIIS